MGYIVIDVFGDDTEDENEKAPKPEPKAKPERPRLRKQVINVDGEIVDLD